MGLDSYLYAEQYIDGWDWGNSRRADQFENVLSACPDLPPVTKDSPHGHVEVCAAYWRKANAIHNWFVQNVQGGKDECQRSYVDPEQLDALIDACNSAIAAYDDGDYDAARELVTPTSGFFFGGTDVDEYYRADLERTVKQLEPLLAPARAGKFSLYYRASW